MAAEAKINGRVQAEIWSGVVPVLFKLEESEIRTDPPLPLYMMLPRMSYLPLCAQNEIYNHFFPASNAKLRNDPDSQTWFSVKPSSLNAAAESIPLKWNLPVGVLFDLFADKTKLPLEIVVHFDNYPSQRILASPRPAVIQNYFLHTLKEASYIKWSEAVAKEFCSNLTKHQFKDRIMNAIKHRQPESQRMQIEDAFSSFDDKEVIRVPVRILIRGPETLTPEKQEEFDTCMQPPVPLKVKKQTEKGEIEVPQTLLTLLQSECPGILTAVGSDQTLEDCELIIQGVSPPLNTPLEWLSQYFIHPDQFL
jgi:autophagy-related protein 5